MNTEKETDPIADLSMGAGLVQDVQDLVPTPTAKASVVDEKPPKMDLPRAVADDGEKDEYEDGVTDHMYMHA